MGSRLQLQIILEDLLGSRNVYFQPPETISMTYPCIVYSRDADKTNFANDKSYSHRFRYSLVIMDRNPDSAVLEKVAKLPMCSFTRHYTKDNLNHDVYNLYY